MIIVSGNKFMPQLGGFTSTIGDPTGRSTHRPELSEDSAAAHLAAIKDCVLNIFRNHSNIFWAQQRNDPLPEVRSVSLYIYIYIIFYILFFFSVSKGWFRWKQQCSYTLHLWFVAAILNRFKGRLCFLSFFIATGISKENKNVWVIDSGSRKLHSF